MWEMNVRFLFQCFKYINVLYDLIFFSYFSALTIPLTGQTSRFNSDRKSVIEVSSPNSNRTFIVRHNIEPANLSLRLVVRDFHTQRSFERVCYVSDLQPGYTHHRIQLDRPTPQGLSCVCRRSLKMFHSSLGEQASF